MRAADQPRLAARRRAGVAGLELVDEHDLLALARQPPGQGGPEDTGTDDHDAHGVLVCRSMHLAAVTAVAAAVFGHSAEGAPLKVVSQGSAERQGRRARRRLHPRQRARRGAGGRSTATDAAAGRGAHAHRAHRQPDGAAARATTRAASTSTATSPQAGGRVPRGPLPLRPEGRLRARDARGDARSCGGCGPAVTVWFHQHLDCVNRVARRRSAVVRRYARASAGRRACCRLPRAPRRGWQNRHGPTAARRSSSSFRPARLSRRRGLPAPARDPGDRCPPRPAPSAPRPSPPSTSDLIPFPESRVPGDARATAERHYGRPIARLSEPAQIVQHVTAGGTYSLRPQLLRDRPRRPRARTSAPTSARTTSSTAAAASTRSCA